MTEEVRAVGHDVVDVGAAVRVPHAAALARGRVAGLDAVVDRFADEVLAAAEDREADEVLLSSISLGAVMMSEAIARALARNPAMCIGFRIAACRMCTAAGAVICWCR